MAFMYYDVPVFFEASGRRVIGQSTSVIAPVIRGMRVFWPEPTPVQLVMADTPNAWARTTVAVVPSGEADPATVYAVLALDGDADKITPDDVYLVVPDVGADSSWERMTFATLDADYWAQYRNTYVAPGQGMYFADTYRAAVKMPDTLGHLVPPSWLPTDQGTVAAQHPNMREV